MHYQFKAMQKAMASVGVNNSFADRPVYRKIKQIASITNPADLDRTVIDNKIKEIESIIVSIKNTSISSKKVKSVMEPINKQIIEALEAYLSAWRMMITFHDEKASKQKEKMEEQVMDEDMDECPEDEDYEESKTDKVYNKILTLAENAEITLQDAEKLMKDTFDDNNLDGE